MNPFALTIGLSLVSAVAYAMAAVVQQRLAASLPASASLVTALRHPRWWWSVALNGFGALLHAGALRYGPLTVVQPLGTLTLGLALPLGAALGSRKVTRGEKRGATFTVIGLAGLLVLTAEAEPVHVLGTGSVLLVGSVTAIVLLALILIAARSTYPAGKALTYAAGAGIASGVASSLAQTIVVDASVQGLGALADPVLFMVLGMATAGLLLSQAAYRDAGLGGPLAMSTLANPIAAAAIGLTLLGEGYDAGFTGAGLAVVAAVVAGYGVALLASGTPAEDRRHERIRVPRRELANISVRVHRLRVRPLPPSGTPPAPREPPDAARRLTCSGRR
jgi:hypothetical protein